MRWSWGQDYRVGGTWEEEAGLTKGPEASAGWGRSAQGFECWGGGECCPAPHRSGGVPLQPTTGMGEASTLRPCPTHVTPVPWRVPFCTASSPPILPRPPTAPPDHLVLPPQFDVSAVLKFGPVRLIIPLRVSNISFKVGAPEHWRQRTHQGQHQGLLYRPRGLWPGSQGVCEGVSCTQQAIVGPPTLQAQGCTPLLPLPALSAARQSDRPHPVNWSHRAGPEAVRLTRQPPTHTRIASTRTHTCLHATGTTCYPCPYIPSHPTVLNL